MLSISDCVGMCGLNEDELRVLADHEHVPMIVAAELAAGLLDTPQGAWKMRSFMLEALESAVARRDWARERHLRGLIVTFTSSHHLPPAH